MPITKPIPEPNDNPRRIEASRRRQLATEIAINRPQPGIDRAGPPTSNNGEEAAFTESYASSFTKGLPRDKFGLVDPHSYGHFVDAINHESATVAGGVDRFDMTVPLGPYQEPDANIPIMDIGDHPKFYTTKKGGTAFKVRNWESPRAGHVYDLEGPDADAVCMPPAPKVISDEMAVEMAEVYAMALLRDTPFETISKAGNGTHGYSAKQAALDIADMDWFDPSVPRTGVEAKRLMARDLLHKPSGSESAAKKTARAKTNAANLFRGSTPGCKDGPYISQFLIAGTSGRGGEGTSVSKHPIDSSTFGPEDGCIVYGNQSIDQRVFSAKEGMDYMTEWLAWMDVQNAANKKGVDQFESKRRFITTQRDLATYVHFDELYQAYLNATFMVAGMDVKPDQGFPTGRKTDKTRGSFATFGGPHVLALLTEVSTRALRAVRRQKYNYHRRCRPEAIGGMLSLSASTDADAIARVWDARPAFDTMRSKLPSRLLDKIDARNTVLATASESAKRHIEVPTTDKTTNGLHKSAFDEGDPNYLLPMAFPEGSPMHPAYGAGHATVAGACVTVVKAFFNMYQEDDPHALRAYPGKKIFEPDLGSDGSKLVDRTSDHPSLTLVGELNKLAANISIGRNMAGVHFYTDYYDSLRMGERIAIGMLQEQMTNYPEDVAMTLPGFGDDGTGLGEKIRIATSPDGASSSGHPVVQLWNATLGRYENAGADWWLCRL